MGKTTTKLSVRSDAFQNNQPIPRMYSGEDQDMSPPLTWSGVPAQAKELVLIVDDPDAPHGPFVHWVLYKLHASLDRLKQGLPTRPELTQPTRARQGENSSGRIGYMGPMPPKGHGKHHYHFKLYAMDSELDLAAGATKEELLDAMNGHVIAEGETMGTYER